MISPISDLSGIAYRGIAKPLFFQFPADQVHESLSAFGEVLVSATPLRKMLSTMWSYSNPILEQNLLGINFANPVGLAAGFDYHAQLTQALPAIGFGWHSIGTISIAPYGGNQPPMLGRLPLSQSLWVNKGFKNKGAADTITKLTNKPLHIPTGISIGSTNRAYKSMSEQISEYEQAFIAFEESGLSHDYYELNISCPNLVDATNFQDPANLPHLLKMVESLRLKRPVLVKMPIDIDDSDFSQLISQIAEVNLAGVIVGNLTKDRSNPTLFQTEVQKFQKGGFSGKPTFSRSNHKIRLSHRLAGNQLLIVGTGGIFSATDAYYKIRCGASLLQLITGLIYQGPQVVGQINRDLAALLKHDGFNSISEAVGVE